MRRRASEPRLEPPPTGVATDSEEAHLLPALDALHRAIFKYPIAIKAAFSALVAEGRSYAETEEGAVWCERLSQAKMMGRARLLWEVLSLSAFTERNDEPLPSVFADTLVRALKSQHLEPLLSKVLERRL